MTITAKLQQANQTKLLRYLNDESVPAQTRQILSEELAAMDLDSMMTDLKAAQTAVSRIALEAATSMVEGPSSLQSSDWELLDDFKQAFKQANSPVTVVRINDLKQKPAQAMWDAGAMALRHNKVACLLLAGGQGSRLGFEGPKGNYKPGFPSGASIFQVLMCRLKRLGEILSGPEGKVTIPIYIMTSTSNQAATIAHFEENEYFGLEKSQVVFFNQTMMPSFDKEGNILLEDDKHVTQNANGNGGVFKSLQLTGLLGDLKKRGVEYLHVFGVDNVLCKVADPLFLGACITADVAVGNKCIAKTDPHEKIGVTACRRTPGTNRAVPCVVEYTEITKDQAEARVGDSQDTHAPLKLSSGNICNHFFQVKFIEDLLQNPNFNYHIAFKKIPHFDLTTKERVSPSEPNGIKLEYFIFDAFLASPALLVLEGDRAEEFSPVKNATGGDSPATAVEHTVALHTKWLKKAGAVMADGKRFELAPGVTYESEGLAAQFGGVKMSEQHAGKNTVFFEC